MASRALEIIAAEARAQGLKPWMAIKERLAARTIEVLARVAGPRAVLQGGAAVHFVYGSPRLSADVDVVGLEAATALTQSAEQMVHAAGSLLELPCTWSTVQAGRLMRAKLTLTVDAARKLVLPVEALAVPSHRPSSDQHFGAVEEPQEIVADKLVASADRLARRGSLKLSDLFDLWHLCARLGTALPDRSLIAAKLADYGQPGRGLDLAAAIRAVPLEEVRAALSGLLPVSELDHLRVQEVVDTAANVAREYHDAL